MDAGFGVEDGDAAAGRLQPEVHDRLRVARLRHRHKSLERPLAPGGVGGCGDEGSEDKLLVGRFGEFPEARAERGRQKGAACGRIHEVALRTPAQASNPREHPVSGDFVGCDLEHGPVHAIGRRRDPDRMVLVEFERGNHAIEPRRGCLNPVGRGPDEQGRLRQHKAGKRRQRRALARREPQPADGADDTQRADRNQRAAEVPDDGEEHGARSVE